jgi:hypothetical protein
MDFLKDFRVDIAFPVFMLNRKERTMLKVRLAVVSLAIAMMLPAPSALLAQTAKIAAAAPLPSQIVTAKKIFISNAATVFDRGLWTGGPAQPYNELYAAMNSWGHYDLVGAPGDADIVLEISLAGAIAGAPSLTAVEGAGEPQIKLVLLDPKTRIVLWTLNEDTNVNHMQKGRNQSLEDTINKLVADLKALTAQPVATAK